MLRYITNLFVFLFVISGTLAFAYDNGAVPVNTVDSARRMITDLVQTFGDKYAGGASYLKQLDGIESRIKANGEDEAARAELDSLIRTASLANPLLDFDKILIVRRRPLGGNFGFVGLNSYTNDTVRRTGWDNELVVISNLRGTPEVKPFYRHANQSVIRDINLHFDGKRVIFSSINQNGNWAIYEVDTDGKNLKELTPADQKDVDWWDACYLPEEGYIVTGSTAGMQGLPCENGGRKMSNLYRVNTNDKTVRQLTFEQDSDWHPSIMHDGRVMYLRWEYSDIPHYMSRILFAMQPDGQQQRAIWGSGSYFPTAFKNPRVVPNHSSMVVGVVSGHHTNPNAFGEVGRLILINPQLASKYPFKFDPPEKEWAKERSRVNVMTKIFPKEVTGCVQEIPGYGRDVVGNVYDNQGGDGKYKFVYPYPLSENYFLVSMRLNDRGMFGLWLVDRFDNMTKIMELPQDALLQPIPLAATKTPPLRADTTDPESKTGQIFITDVYAGPGMAGVPRGAAKSLRIFAYHYGYNNSGGHESVGMVSSWDIKRILGTVLVEEDGSASFSVPANTPISIQVLDEEGRALQLMRSWTVCMPGERQACIGCHETPLEVTPARMTKAAGKAPATIKSWYGEARPFGYEAEIQPMLEQNCVHCHNDVTKDKRGMVSFEARNTGDWRKDTSYSSLNPFCWRPGPEGELDMLTPLDYHASVSELIQRLKKGHYGVENNENVKEIYDRLYTWIDLNVPYRGQWTNPKFEQRRLELQQLYANLDVNPEAEYRESLSSRAKVEAPPKLSPEQLDEVVNKAKVTDDLKVEKWPFDAKAASDMQKDRRTLVVDFRRDNGQTVTYQNPRVVIVREFGVPRREMTFVRIPAGTFVAGQLDGAFPDERRRQIVKIDRPFWIAETEVTNGQYAEFDKNHDSRYLREDGKDHTVPGYIANHHNQPVIRVSYQEAEEFCKWLSTRLGGKRVELPTAGQWEWAARAGTETPFYYGDYNADFSKFANLAGGEVRRTYTTWEHGSTIHERRWYAEGSLFPLRDDRFSDKWIVGDYVKQYEPNQWGLYDMIGNVWEWTKAENETQAEARGGSWKDRPKVTGASTRVYYNQWQKVINVGFRPVIIE